MKHLLVVYHSKTGHTRALIEAVRRGATADGVNVDLEVKRAPHAEPRDLLWADGLILGTPENFGYMSGAMKDFLDRTFYEVEGKLNPLPYALVVAAGNDGTGAVRAIERIVGGYPFVRIQEPIISRGEPTAEIIEQCTELGTAVAAGLELGIF